MRSNAWQQRVMDVEFIFAARKSLWHRLSADSSSQLKWGLPATRNKAVVAIERELAGMTRAQQQGLHCRTERYGASWGVPGNQSL